MKSKEELLDELLAKQEISELNARYCRGCDRCDEELLASVYHPDAVDNHGHYNGSAKGFAKWATEFHRTLICSSHFIMNSLVEVAGDNASGEIYMCGRLRSRRPDGTLEDVTVGARYIDSYERREGVWKIAVRSLLVDWHTITDVKEHPPGGLAESFRWGSRDRSDASYRAVDQHGYWSLASILTSD